MSRHTRLFALTAALAASVALPAQARWSALSVSFSDAARVTTTQIYELATYVQQSNPEVARQILSVLSRDVSTTAALGATLGAMMLTYISGKAAKNGD